MKFSRKERARRHGGRRSPIHSADMDVFLQELQHDKPDYKTLALCKQAARALSSALSGSCGDPVLQDLTVMEAVPAPFAGRLQITLLAGAVASELPLEEVYHRLDLVSKMLRAEVAAAVCRKRAPELAFVVLRRPEVQP